MPLQSPSWVPAFIVTGPLRVRGPVPDDWEQQAWALHAYSTSGLGEGCTADEVWIDREQRVPRATLQEARD